MDVGACSSSSSPFRLPGTQVAVEEKIGSLVGKSVQEQRDNVSPGKRRLNISNKYKPGVDFKEAPLSEKDGEVFDLSFVYPPTNFSPEGTFKMDSENPKVTCQKLEGMKDVWVFDNFMTPSECEQMIEITDAVGYRGTNRVGIAHGEGKLPASKACWLLDLKSTSQLFERIQEHLPTSWKDKVITGINPRFRFYKYYEDYMLGMHQDVGQYPLSYVDEDGELRHDYPQDEQLSQMSLLIYLNDGFGGGETTFFEVEGEGGEEEGEGRVGGDVVRKFPVVPVKGNGVVFWHGDHPDSPFHEGSVVTEGVKYIIRTDILFRGPKVEKEEESEEEEEEE